MSKWTFRFTNAGLDFVYYLKKPAYRSITGIENSFLDIPGYWDGTSE